jgi:hypothetical protein
MKKALEYGGQTLEYFLIYLPDMNPIEKKRAVIKALQRCLRCSVEALFQKTQNLALLQEFSYIKYFDILFDFV